ncbi:MAG: hypothetical protein ACK56I_02485, partial [bacterium]
ALARNSNAMDELDDFGEDVFDEADIEEVATVVESDRPMKRSRSTHSDGEAADEDASQDTSDDVEVWQRPAVPEWDATTRPLHFQWLSIDICGGEPLKSNPAPGRGVAGSKHAPVPILLLYGVNDEGNSVLCRVHGFTPYFYFSAPPAMTRAHLPAVRAALEANVSKNILLLSFTCLPASVSLSTVLVSVKPSP